VSIMIRRTLLGLFLFVLAALPSAAQFNGCVAGFCSSSSQWVFPGATLDLDFANNRYFGVANGINSLTTTRASTGYAEALNGTWVNFGNNIARRTDKGLLVEESRTNSIRNNSMQGASAGSPGTLPTNWISNLDSALTRTVDVGTSLGIDYLDVTQVGTTATTGGSLNFEGTKQVAATVGQTWTLSGFFALPSGSTANITNIRLLIIEKNSGGTTLTIGVGSSFAGSLTSALQRISLTYTTVNASTAFLQPAVQLSYANGAVLNITLRIGWPQLELGAFATSPIRTTNTEATRAADVVTLGLGPWFNASEGTLYADILPTAAIGSQAFVSLDDGTSNERIMLRANSAAISGLIVDGGVSQANIAGGTLVANVTTKSALAYASNDAALSTNGGAVGTDTSVNLPTVTMLNFGSRLGNGSDALNGYLRRTSYFPSRLPNATLQSITQ